MSALIYRRTFHDPASLKLMMQGYEPRIGDIKRRIFVTERRSEPGWPDHFHKNYLEKRLAAVTHTHQLARHVMNDLATRFIVRLDGKLRIVSNQFLEWQELLPSISPLAVAVAFLVKEGKGPGLECDPRHFLAAELGSTALMTPFQPTLEAMIERDGLNELHMHLNGSTEADLIWAAAAGNPVQFWRSLQDDLTRNREGTVAELYDQLEIGLRPRELRDRLLAARRVRHLIANQLRRLRYGFELNLCSSKLFTTLRSPLAGHDMPLSSPPAAVIFGRGDFEPLIDEAGFLYTWLKALDEPATPRRELGLGLYFQFLVQAQISAISVQQQDQVGFDQFQKFTMVGARSGLEKSYEARFRQLNRALPYRTLTHLEGRFAPKDEFNDLNAMIEKILKGYLDFRGCPSRTKVSLIRSLPGCVFGRCDCNGSVGREDAELSLVAHLIKMKEGRRPHKLALHGRLANRIMRQTRVLTRALSLRGVAEIVRGMDAAANELHAPPEVFAPGFRFLRAKGLDRATYHAGEDFVHLVSGIRATHEALRFLPLLEGDRIGHATALGIEPTLWRGRIGTKIVMACGEHLDNLVYAYTRLAGNKTMDEALRWPTEIAQLGQKIYGKDVAQPTLEFAWRMRRLDIMLILDLERREGLVPGHPSIVDAARRVARRTAGAARRAELELIATRVDAHPTAYWFARERHRQREKLEKLEEFNAAWISAPALRVLQSGMLERLAKGRVAIETLPSSNVSISFYERYSEHHLFRWLGLSGEKFSEVPDVCVGSDDTGIFATSLHNEYALLFETLCRNFGHTPRDATALLADLNRNGFAHRFAPRSSSHHGIGSPKADRGPAPQSHVS